MITLNTTNTVQGSAASATAITYTIFGLEVLSGTETYGILAQGQLGSSNGTLYTVAASTTSLIKSIWLCNATGSAVASIAILINGSAAANKIISSLTIPANGVAILDDGGLRVIDATGNTYTSGTNIFATTLPLDTTPLTDSVAGSATTAARIDHTHQSPGGIAALTATSGAIANTETLVISAIIPANLMAVGTTFRIRATGIGTTSTSPGSSIYRCRIGSGTLSDNIACTVTVPDAASQSTIGFSLELLCTVRTNGASGTILGGGHVVGGVLQTTAAVAGQTTATVVVDTTASRTIQLTYISGAASSNKTFYNATIEIVSM